MNNVQELIQLIQLEQIEENIFRGNSYRTPWKRVFGGQVLAQALNAAYQTAPEGRFAHSMHGYFILPGDIEKPIVYSVDRTRDGGSFTTRRVSAIQNGRAIFVMAASFQIEEEGFAHQVPMPNVPPPENLMTDQELSEAIKDFLPEVYRRLQMPRPIEFRPVEGFELFSPKKHQPFRHVWIKAKGNAPEGKVPHQEILAYASDYDLLTTAILPHRDQISFKDLMLATIDHAMWFHRNFRMDEWLLYALESPSASNSRGFTRGSVFNRRGELVASVTQEGLIRKKRFDEGDSK